MSRLAIRFGRAPSQLAGCHVAAYALAALLSGDELSIGGRVHRFSGGRFELARSAARLCDELATLAESAGDETP